jgi:hypothetical protein
MHPTPEQIAVAAYHRWQRRGFEHGRELEDWAAAEKDLTFGLNYRWAVRHALRASASGSGAPVLLGQPQNGSTGRARHCRFCEKAEPAASFAARPWAVPPILGNNALVAWDECDDCRAQYEASLAGPFEAFARPLIGPDPAVPDPAEGVPVAALKALVRMGLATLPASELHYFDDTVEWLTNPDHDRDASILGGLGCHVYITPTPIPAPFASLARRSDDDASVPYMLFFLGTSRVVFQTHLPFCPRDEDLDDNAAGARGPELSMSLGSGRDYRPSLVTFLPAVSVPEPSRGRHAPHAAGVGR